MAVGKGDMRNGEHACGVHGGGASGRAAGVDEDVVRLVLDALGESGGGFIVATCEAVGYAHK